MNKLMHVPLILAGLSVTSAGFAAERNKPEVTPYVGGGIGYYRINDEDFLDNNDRLKDNRHALRAHAGVEVGRIFAIEGAYTDFGSTSDDTADMELTGLSVAAVLSIPLFELVVPYGKIGVMSWDRERSYGLLSDSDGGEDVFLGVGARFSLMHRLDMRLEFERFEIDETDIDMASVNLQFRF